MRDPALCAAASGTQVAQREVRGQVAELADGVESESGVGDVGIRGVGGDGGVRAIGPERKVSTGEEPVVRRIFEEVCKGHGGGREAVKEESFELALEEVKNYKGEG